jgi:hypothetical protein
MIAVDSAVYTVADLEPADYLALAGPVQLPEVLASVSARTSPAFTVRDRQSPVPVAVLGLMLPPWRTSAVAWAVIDRTRVTDGRALHYLVCAHLARLECEYDLRAIEARVLDDDPAALRWVRALRFRRVALLPGTGPDGRMFSLWLRHPR